MKLFGLELKFNDFDIWHKGNFDPNSKANSSHTHTKSNIIDFPSSMPANGGNSDTVDNKHAADFLNIGVKVTSGNRSTKAFKKLITIPITSAGNYAVCNIFGVTGGWTKTQGKASINLMIANRDAEFICGEILGTLVNFDIEIYRETDSSLSVYAVLNSYVAEFLLFYNGSQYTIVNGAESTTAPTGMLIYRFSRDYNLKIDESSGYIKSNEIWNKGNLTKLSQLQNDIGAGGGVKITTSATAPDTTSPGDFWYKEV